MQIGAKIKALRLKKGLTQEELGERTDLTKGYISQLERDLNSPSIETLFNILEVLGSTPKEFFDDTANKQPVVYTKDDQTSFTDQDKKYTIEWLIPTSNEKEMEPVILTLNKDGEFKQFEPSLSETLKLKLVNAGRDETLYPNLSELAANPDNFNGMLYTFSDSKSTLHVAAKDVL